MRITGILAVAILLTACGGANPNYGESSGEQRFEHKAGNVTLYSGAFEWSANWDILARTMNATLCWTADSIAGRPDFGHGRRNSPGHNVGPIKAKLKSLWLTCDGEQITDDIDVGEHEIELHAAEDKDCIQLTNIAWPDLYQGYTYAPGWSHSVNDGHVRFQVRLGNEQVSHMQNFDIKPLTFDSTLN